jgi:ubiquinone biosynthesis protein UbiJ
MPRLKMSDKQRDEIVTLRQKGTKWTEIQKVTKIDRRIAKKAYENWEHNSSVEELQKVRKEVAATEFRTHMESIVKLAESLVSNLGVLPRFIEDMKRNGEEFLGWLWEQDLLQRYSSSKPQLDVYTLSDSQDFRVGDPRIYLDEKKLLYKSLRDHTRGEIDWNILNKDWKNARDRCAESVPQFLTEARQLVDNYVKNANESGFLEKVRRATTKETDPAKNMTWAVVNRIWRLIVIDQPREEPLFETVPKGTTVETIVKFADGTSGLFFKLVGSDRQYLAEKITKQCDSAITVLSEKKVVQELHVEVGNIKRASDTLREMLNPALLRPMILRTRCDLCPA